MSDTRRDIELRIRAQDLSTADFQKVSASVDALAASIDKQISAASKGQISLTELGESMTRLTQAAKSLTGIAGLVDRFKDLSNVVEANKAAVDRAAEASANYRNQLDTSGTATKAEEARLTALVRALQQAEAAYARNSTTLESTRSSLAAAGIDTQNLVSAEQQLKASADQVGPALTKLSEAQLSYARNLRTTKEAIAANAQAQKDSTASIAQASGAYDKQQTAIKQAAADQKAALDKRLADIRTNNAAEKALYQKQVTDLRQIMKGAQQPTVATGTATGSAATTLFGFKPYELQNLSYQINDVVSGIVSGQRLSQIAAQQGGQILQLFNHNLFDLIKYVPEAAVVIGTLVVAFSALNAALADQQALRDYTAQINLFSTNTKYQAQGLVDIQRAVRAYGVSWQDAATIIKEALAAGLHQDQITKFTQAAQDMSDILGGKVTDNFKLFLTALSGSNEDILKLNDALHGAIPADVIARIAALNQQGKGGEAAAIGINAAIDALRKIAPSATSPTTQAFRELSTAWGDFTDALGKSTGFQAAVGYLNDLQKHAKDALIGWKLLIENINKPGAIAALGLALGKSAGDIATKISPILPFIPALPSAPTSPSATTTQTYAPGTAPFVDTGSLKVDTDQLKKLVEVLNEAGAASLPAGQRIKVISTERPGATVAGTDTPSEHGFGHAIDVVIVDANGNPVIDPNVKGQMGPGAPSKAFDDAMIAAAAKLNAGPLAVGSTFRSNYDPGHYSLGGNEAQTNAANRGPVPSSTAPAPLSDVTPEELANHQKILDAQKLEIESQNTYNEAQARSAKIAQINADAVQKFGNDADGVNQYVAAETTKYDSQVHAQKLQFAEQEQNILAGNAGKEVAIQAAGAAAQKKYLDDRKGEIISLSDSQQAYLKGEQEYIKNLNADTAGKSALEALEKQVDALLRGGTSATDLANKLAGVNSKYTDINKQLDLFKTKYPNIQVPADTVDKLAAAQAKEVQTTTADTLIAQANAGAQTRNELLATYKSLLDSGAIDQDQFEQKSKAAYEGTAAAITTATKALQDYLATADKIDPTKVELLTAKIQELNAQAKYTDPLFKAIKDAAGEGFAAGISQGFNTIAQAIGNVIAKTGTWKDVLSSVEVGVGQLFSTLLKDIAEAILKYEALKIASKFTGDSKTGSSTDSGGFDFGSIFGKLFGGLFGGSTTSTAAVTAVDPLTGLLHEGGLVGVGGSGRSIHGMPWMHNAPRYHTGTIVGLQPDEYQAVLKKGEEVLATDDPRNAMTAMKKATGGAAPNVNIRSVLVADPAFVPQGMAGAAGEKVIVDVIRSNIPTIRQLIKG